MIICLQTETLLSVSDRQRERLCTVNWKEPDVRTSGDRTFVSFRSYTQVDHLSVIILINFIMCFLVFSKLEMQELSLVEAVSQKYT